MGSIPAKLAITNSSSPGLEPHDRAVGTNLQWPAAKLTNRPPLLNEG